MAPRLGLILDSDCEGYWDLDATGNITDQSAYGHTMVLTGASALADGQIGNARVVGPSASGAGGTNYFSSAVDAASDARMIGEFTVEAWGWAPASGILAITSFLPGYGVPGAAALITFGVDSGQMSTGYNDVDSYASSILAPTAQWALYGARKRVDGSDGYIDQFLNGRLTETFGPFALPVLGAADRKFWLGSNGKHWTTGTGRLDIVRISNIARTDAEMFESWRRGVGFYTMASQAEHMRAQVKDSGGTWRDLTSYPGFNAVKSATWRADIDDPLVTATIQLKRELEGFSLAPLMETSAANLAFNPAGSYAPLLDVAREVRIDVAVVPMDLAPVSADWVTRFHGYIDIVDAASSDAYVSLECRDKGAYLADKFIETERFYSLADDSGPVSYRVFQPSTAYALGEYVVPTDKLRNGTTTENTYFFEVTTAGTSGAEPSPWRTTAGTESSGSVVFTLVDLTADVGTEVEDIMQLILDDNDAGVTLYTLGTPDWAVKGFIQQREPVLSALRALATQNGWDCRYRWNDGTQGFELTFYEPDREQTFENYSFSASDYKTISRGAMDITRVRNVCAVIYSDPADLEADGLTKKRKSQSYTDASSVTRFGRRFMEIAEADTSNIDTAAEALRLATAAVLDLKDPLIDLGVQVALGFPWVELGHMYGFEPNSRHFSVAQSVAVAGFSQSASDGRLITAITLRGKPAGRYTTWHKLSVHPSGKPGRPLSGPQSGTSGGHGAFDKIPDVKDTRQNVAPPVLTPVTLVNGWLAAESTTPGYYRNAVGEVKLEGAIKDGTLSAVDEVCTLPYAPLVTQLFLCACDAPSWPTLALVLVDTDGKVYALEGDTTYIYLNQISFRADV